MSKARELAQKPNQSTGRKNLIINGAMVIDQRNSGSAVTGSGAVAKFAADRYSLYANTSATITAQQVSDAPDGFEKSNKFTCTTAAPSDVSGSRVQLYQAIEGYNAAHLQFGSSNAKTITLSFWVKASNTGTYGGAFTNGVVNRAYPYQYTISSANTWEYKTVTITGDTSGTWATDNAGGLYLFWSLGVGSDYEGTANQWNGAFDIAPPSSFSLKDNLNATWQITGVQLEVGSVATEFEHRSFGEELALCQRYYYLLASGDSQTIPTGSYYASNLVAAAVEFPVTMRINPSLDTVSGTNYYGVYANNTLDTFNVFSGIGRSSTKAASLDAYNSGASGTVGHSGPCRTNNSNAYLGFDAEL